MSKTLTLAEIESARRILESSGPKAMYDFFSAKDYKYANLANGVAKGDSLSGAAALNFMQVTASASGSPLSEVQVGNIKRRWPVST